jgi:hypothetical protein
MHVHAGIDILAACTSTTDSLCPSTVSIIVRDIASCAANGTGLLAATQSVLDNTQVIEWLID